MKNKIIVLVILIIGFFVYRNFFANSDRREISNILTEIEKSLEYEKPLPPLAVVLRLRTITSHLAPEFFAKSIDDDNERVLADIDKIKENALIAAQYFSDIEILRLPLIVNIKGNRATTSFKATISGQDKQGEEFRELFNISLEFIKLENRWYCLSILAERLTPDK